ncbi:MAG: class I SAM-dependent methyltransferase [Bacteroidia bacterium]|nr:class I SAM-dependent methyltransferase [Bacteroidia bacterium]
MWYYSLVEKNKIPDFLIRIQIRKLLKQRLRDENKGNSTAQQNHLNKLIEELKSSAIAVNTSDANEQHYEVPTQFYQYCLGKHLKYSSGFWKEGVTDIDTSERDMLEITCERAELKNGQNVLELGCGWGSLSLFMAEKFPQSNFTVVSNSRAQKIYIDDQAKKRGITNLTVVTADINVFSTEEKFDRIVSVEMFEHLRNYQELFQKISDFLNAEGKMFVHVFTHKEYSYKFEVIDESDWMSKYFFTGGIMPGKNLLPSFNDHFTKEKEWDVNGMHYSKTSEAWLRKMDAHKKEIIPIFETTYGKDAALKWWVYWRIFFMACAELWGFKNGTEWQVTHYLFIKK